MLTGDGDRPLTRQAVQPEDDCPICYEILGSEVRHIDSLYLPLLTLMQELLFCALQCGVNLHKVMPRRSSMHEQFFPRRAWRNGSCTTPRVPCAERSGHARPAGHRTAEIPTSIWLRYPVRTRAMRPIPREPITAIEIVNGTEGGGISRTCFKGEDEPVG